MQDKVKTEDDVIVSSSSVMSKCKGAAIRKCSLLHANVGKAQGSVFSEAAHAHFHFVVTFPLFLT